MARVVGRWMEPRRLLGVAVVALVVLSLTPARHLAFAGWFGTLAQTLAAPVSHPVSRVVGWVTPGGSLPAAEGTADDWRDRAEAFETLYLREREENARLRSLVEDLQAGVAIAPGVSVRQLSASVVAASSDLASGLLTVRTPAGAGVSPRATVAIVEGIQLLGTVDSASPLLCQVRPITDASSPRLEGVVILGDSRDAPRLLCTLSPTGSGTLAGPVESAAGLAESEGLQRGQRVRLADPTWPASAQQLVIGVVERIDSNPDQPLRKQIVVRPLVDLSRVREVVLRIPIAGGVGGGTEGGGP
ncbi:MAG: rod shape-determining protein MreC [Phycisphaerales bacterium]